MTKVAVLDIVVGRQPIFDRELTVIGYELLFREVEGDSLADADGDLMTTSVLFRSVGIGINRLVGDKMIFCNADRGLLVGSIPVVLMPEQTVFEIAGTLPGDDDEILAGCEELVQRGYTLALDHFHWREGCERLLTLASIVKVDLAEVASDDLPGLIERCRGFGVSLVAEKVETPDQLRACQELGFDYFQGYLLSRPRVVPGRTLDTSSVARLEIAARLAQSECSADELEQIIRSEPAMAYQLLQMAGVGAHHGCQRNVKTLREALVIVGWRQLQSWISFLILTNKGRTSEEEVITTLTRARMTELLAQLAQPHLAGLAFTAGMISAFDLLLGCPLADVLLSLPLDDELHDAIVGGEGPIGRIVADVVDCQFGRPELALRSGIDERELHKASIKALSWALEVSRGFVPTDRRPALRRKPVIVRS